MLQPKNIKKQKGRVWRDFSILDFVVLIALFFLSALIGFTVFPSNFNQWIKIGTTIGLFIVLLTLLIKSSRHNCRVYVLIFRMFIFWFRIKRYSKKHINTNLLIPYDEIINNRVVKTKALKDGVKYFSIIKFNGKSPWNEDESDINLFLSQFNQLLDSVENHISIIRVKELIDYQENFYTLFKNKEKKLKTLQESDASEEVIRNYLSYYETCEQDLEMLDKNLYVDAYYITVYHHSISDLNRLLETIYAQLNLMGTAADIVSGVELVALLGRLNHKQELDWDLVNQYLKQQENKSRLKTNNQVEFNEQKGFKGFLTALKYVFGIEDKKQKQKTNNDEIKLHDLIKSEEVRFKGSYFIKDNKYYSIQLLSELPIQLSDGWSIPMYENKQQVIWSMGVINDSHLGLLLDKANKKTEDNKLMTNSKFLSKSSSLQLEALEYLENQVQVNGNSLFNSWFLITNEADSLKELKKIEKQNFDTAKRNKISLINLPFKQFEAFSQSCLIPSINLNEEMIMSSYNIAHGWAFENETNNDGNAFILGESSSTGEPIIFDQFYKRSSRRVNYNMFSLGSSGKGKSTDVKKAILGHLSHNNKVYIIDAQNEYKKIGSYFNATNIDLGIGNKTIINPLEIQVLLKDDSEEYSIELVINKHCDWLEDFFSLVEPEFSSDHKAMIMRCVREIYDEYGFYGIKNYKELKSKRYPIITDLINRLKNYDDYYRDPYEKQRKQDLVYAIADRLSYLFEHNGKYQFIYNGETNINLNNDFVIFNTQKLFTNNDSKTGKVGLFVLLSFLSNKIYSNFVEDKSTNTVIVIDELHIYIDPENMTSLNFVYTMTKTVRKFNAGMVLCTQNPSDFLGNNSITSKAQAILQNCQYAKFFGLRQKDLEAVEKMFQASGGLNKSQIRFIADSDIGNVLFSLHMYSKIKAKVYYNEFEESLFFDKGRIGDEWNGTNEN